MKKSIFKKVRSIAKNGIDPIRKGRQNYNRNLPKYEDLAKQRLETCNACPEFVNEPVKAFRIEDKRIPELSNKMCDECGCSSTYLLRQNIKVCSKWKE